VATLTYVYSDSTAVVGPLASFAEPHSYDLCEGHAVNFTVPRGWEVMRHAGEFPAPIPHADDLEALAEAVREAARLDATGVPGWRPPVARDARPAPLAGATCASCRRRHESPPVGSGM